MLHTCRLARKRLAIACLWLAAFTAKSSLGQTITLQSGTPEVSGGNGSFTLFLPILNAGTATAGSVAVTSATLSGVAASGSLPLQLSDILAGKVSFANLRFNSGALVTGNKYLLTIRGTYTLGGTAFGFAINRFILLGALDIFQKPANPITVTPMLDSSHSVQTPISAVNGGTITATGADGSVFTLTIPPNALLSDELITMTPIASIGNIPLSGGFAAGVELQPQGLRFFLPATLTITSPTTAPAGQQWGFSYGASGADFHIYPLNLTAAITMNILHFTGFGWGMAPSLGSTLEAVIALKAEQRLEQQIAQLTEQERARQLDPNNQPPSDNPQYLENIATLLQQAYRDAVQPLLDAAVGDSTFLEKAAETALAWEKTLELEGLAGQEPFKSEIAATKSALVQLTITFYNNSFARCLAPDGVPLVESAIMFGVWKQLLLLGQDSLLPNFKTQLAACAAGQLLLTFDSTMMDVGEVVGKFDFNSHVLAQDLPMRFDTTKLEYTGDGLLSYPSFTGMFHWPPPSFDCGSRFIPGPGTIAVTGVIDLNVNFLAIPQPSDVRVLVTVVPTISDLIIASVAGPDSPCFSLPLSSDNYMVDYGILHYNGQGSNGILPYAVFVNTPTPFGINGFGVSGGVLVEQTTVTLANPM
jgi:hypothetical protein